MAGFGDLVQKAFYLGVGVASYAAEKAGGTLTELRTQAQKIADEMVARGEITADDAKRMVDEVLNRAQQSPPTPEAKPPEPRRIEILEENDPEPEANPQAVDSLREQVAKLQEELKRLKRE
jgi:polyhydroxyalkanoate synthesis regulator phasin